MEKAEDAECSEGCYVKWNRLNTGDEPGDGRSREK